MLLALELFGRLLGKRTTNLSWTNHHRKKVHCTHHWTNCLAPTFVVWKKVRAIYCQSTEFMSSPHCCLISALFSSLWSLVFLHHPQTCQLSLIQSETQAITQAKIRPQSENIVAQFYYMLSLNKEFWKKIAPFSNWKSSQLCCYIFYSRYQTHSPDCKTVLIFSLGVLEAE